MRTLKNIKEFQNYLERGLEILRKGDSNSKKLLLSLRDQLNSIENDISQADILSAVYITLHNEKEICEKKLRDVAGSYDEILGLITHEFKNILTSIHGYNMLLENHLEYDKDSESLTHLKDSDRLTRQLFNMTDSLLKMSLGEKGLIKPELKLVDFEQDILEPIKRDLETDLHNKQMRLIFKKQTNSLVVECDEGLMDIVIRNLLINAIKYGKQKTEIIVSIKRTDKDFIVTIKNFNDEIPTDICDGIFKKFKSMKIGSEKGGTGIGLYNVRNIIQLHHGKISCQSSAKKWIEFKMSLPQTI